MHVSHLQHVLLGAEMLVLIAELLLGYIFHGYIQGRWSRYGAR
jgi:hypothetical protein